MAGFHDRNPGNFPLPMAILCHHQPLFQLRLLPAPQPFSGRLCHHPGRLSDGEDEYSSTQIQLFQRFLYRFVRQDVRDCFLNDFFRMASEYAFFRPVLFLFLQDFFLPVFKNHLMVPL